MKSIAKKRGEFGLWFSKSVQFNQLVLDFGNKNRDSSIDMYRSYKKWSNVKITCREVKHYLFYILI